VGFCGVGWGVELAHWGPHFGEEPALSGERGAGNLFFVGCNLGCPYCQNHQISHRGSWDDSGKDSQKRLVAAHLEVQESGCQNVGWVTASHGVPQAVEALFYADAEGFRLPLVFNTSGYEAPETLALLEGIVDVYVPDLKYGPEADFERVGAPENYFRIASEALEAMWAQVGPLELDETGAALGGVLVRHLVLPGGLADTDGVLGFLSESFGAKGWLSLMSQYAPPRDLSSSLPSPLNRPLRKEEYDRAVGVLGRSALCLGWVQGPEAMGIYTPDFHRQNPFEGPCGAKEGGARPKNKNDLE